MKNSSKTLLTAAAAGLAAGGVLGVLSAPDKGSATRDKLNNEIKKMSDAFNGRCSVEKLNKVKGKLETHKEKVEKAIQKINSRIAKRETKTSPVENI